MTASIVNNTQNPLSMNSGGTMAALAAVNVSDPFYYTWDSAYGGGNGTLHIALHSVHGLYGTLTDPGAAGYTTPALTYDAATHTYSEATQGGPLMPSFLLPGEVCHRLVYHAPTVGAGQSESVAATVSYTSTQDASGGATRPQPTYGALVTVTDTKDVAVNVNGAAPTSTAEFDGNYYLNTNPDVAAAHVDPKWHFDNYGWTEGRNPDPLFSTAYYLQHNPDVLAAHINPLWHYQNWGWTEHRDPSAAFSTDGYLGGNHDVAAAHIDPLWHYLGWGQAEGRLAIPV